MEKLAIIIGGNKRMKWEDALLNQVGMMMIARNKELHKEKTDLWLLSTRLLAGAGIGDHVLVEDGMSYMVQPSTFLLLSHCKGIDVTVWCLLH